ncbi:hypothetical protein [Rhizobium sp. AAP43]|uniref:hypothetical protein n=1 Tax=Rhizobium sp. AAP43 TaxID=1523420 RepID=UPI0006B987D3|nr:hypothetical protein [Rhizobium sp. AAP43]KPF46877.1 hypothetical protein IP76_03130 [Rhizobium sp. AAP43]
MRSDRLQDRLQRKLEAVAEERARIEAGRHDVEARAQSAALCNLWSEYRQDVGRHMRKAAVRDLRSLAMFAGFALLGLLAASLSRTLFLLWCVALVACVFYTIGSLLNWVGRIARALLTPKSGR